MPTIVLLNRRGGAAGGDEGIEPTVGAALEAAGIRAEIRLVDGSGIAGHSRAAAGRGDALLIVGGGGACRSGSTAKRRPSRRRSSFESARARCG